MNLYRAQIVTAKGSRRSRIAPWAVLRFVVEAALKMFLAIPATDLARYRTQSTNLNINILNLQHEKY